MSTRKHPSRFRAIRPSAEGLEERQLLSGVISGVDGDGDTWTLKLIGPGALGVVRQNGPDGNPVPLASPGQIGAITVAGTDPLVSRLVGTVKRSATGDGRVFFQSLTELTNRSQQLGSGDGLLSIDMPHFWLGLTNSTGVTSTTEPTILIPDGVNSLRFGGVDVTAFFGQDPTKALNKNGQNNTVTVNLGLPQSGGTRVVVDRVVSDAQSSTSTAGVPTTNQDGVTFTVLGRLSLFQANEIAGNTKLPSANLGTSGGTTVQSLADTGTGVTGQIGNLRIGGNATNLSTITNDRISNYSVGGETNNISILAPNGSRNLYFGKGLDTATILTHSIENLQANRGALNSKVVSDRQIGEVVLGGDVVNTTIQSGYVQRLNQVLSNPANPPTDTAQAGGSIRIRIAGGVTNSVIAASTQPFNGTFGSSQDLRLPLGQIHAKIEGAIDNSTATPDSPNTAFYAQSVSLNRGPVIPPNVPEAPYPKSATPVKLPGITVPGPVSHTKFIPRPNTAGFVSHPTGTTKKK